MSEFNEIGWAVKQMWNGDKVQRQGWNGKGMWLFLVRDWDVRNEPPLQGPTRPFVAMKTVDGAVVPWLCSQSDLLATDWEIVD